MSFNQRIALVTGAARGIGEATVRKLAANYGDPDEILKEDWIAPIPGITTAGSYEEYARDPGRWIYGAKA